MSTPRSSFAKLATELAAEQLQGIGVEVRPDGRKLLRAFFANGEKNDPTDVWGQLDSVIAKIVRTAKSNGITGLTSMTFPGIRDKICPLYPWC